MTDRHGPHDDLSEHLGVLARGRRATRLLERLGASGLALNGCRDLVTLLAESNGDARRQAALVECLAWWAPRDELAALAVLHLLRHELEAMAERVARLGNLESGEAQGDVLAAAWEALTRRPPPARWDRMEVIWSTLRRATSLRRRVPESLPEDFEREAPSAPGCGERWPGLLDASVSAGVLSCAEAVLIVRTRIEGEPLRRVAADLGRPYDALRMQRRRAERALRAYLSGPSS